MALEEVIPGKRLREFFEVDAKTIAQTSVYAFLNQKP